MSTKSSTQPIEERLNRMEAELAELRRLASTSSEASEKKYSVPATRNIQLKLHIHFARSELERLPFALTLEGVGRVVKNLSGMRAAIVLVLLIELLERSEAAPSASHFDERVRESLAVMTGERSEDITADALRMALHRVGQVFSEDFSEVLPVDYRWQLEKSVLNIATAHSLLAAEAIDIDITTSDQAVSALLDRSLASSPLSRLRKAKSLYVPSGEEGQDRLLLELLDHDYPVKQTSVFYRPTIQGFPPELAQKLRLNPNRLARISAATRGVQSGRIHYTEILPKQRLWDFARRDASIGAAGYPGEVSAEDAISHIEHLCFMLRSMPSYQLILTDSFLPFYISTFEILKANEIERFTLFFQNAGEQSVRQVSTFALKDDAVFFSTREKIVSWILSHPTTIRQREVVLEELEALRKALMALA